MFPGFKSLRFPAVQTAAAAKEVHRMSGCSDDLAWPGSKLLYRKSKKLSENTRRFSLLIAETQRRIGATEWKEKSYR